MLFEFIPTPKPALIAELGNKYRGLVVLRPTNSGVPIICVLYKTKTPSSFVCLYHTILDFHSAYTLPISADRLVFIGVFHGCSQSLQNNPGTVSGLCHDPFLSNPFIFIIHQSSKLSTEHNLRYYFQLCESDHKKT